MAQPIDPISDSLKSALPQIRTPATPILLAGGASDSQVLNRLRRSLVDDVGVLDRRTSDNATQISLVQAMLSTQAAALAARLNALAARLPTTTNRWMADLFTTQFVYHTTTCDVNPTYGQATLPLLSQTEKLVGTDTRGQVWIPNGARLTYSYSGAVPNEVDWLTDDQMTHALDQRADTAWWRDRGASGTVWVRVQLPVNLAGNKLANTILLHPFPVLTNDLLSVEYRSPAGTWTAADLSYLPGWDAVRGLVGWAGNVRLFIPQSPVTELRLRLNVPSLWGFSKISVQQTEFQPAGTLVADFSSYAPPTLTQATVFGANPDQLAYLTTQINGALVSVALTQQTANTSPVVTQIEVRP